VIQGRPSDYLRGGREHGEANGGDDD
jgi:hypothetical protein